MPNDRGKDFLFSDDCGFINGEDGESYRYSDGSGYYHGADGSEGYKYSDGSGYFNGANGNRSSYDADEDNDDEDDGDDQYSTGSEFVSFAEGLGSAFGTTLGAALADAMAAAREKEAQQEAERRERQARNKAWRRKHRKGITVCIFILFIASISLLGYYEFSIRIPVGYSSSDLISKNYENVVGELKSAGFSFVSTDRVADLSIEDVSKENLVTSVKIGFTTNFDEDSRYPSNIPIKVQYHTVKEIQAPLSAKEAKNLKYDKVLSKFTQAGFDNITTEVDYDIVIGWFAKEGDVESITVGGDKKFSQGDSYRIDSEVVITYHDLKKNKPK